MAKDPVCGMEVDQRASRHQTRYKGKTDSFCSGRCRSAFEQNPEQYLGSRSHRISAKRKVVVVGTGQVGAAFAFALMESGLASDLVLINRHREKAEGYAMDLNHGLPFVRPASISAGNYADCRDAGRRIESRSHGLCALKRI